MSNGDEPDAPAWRHNVASGGAMAEKLVRRQGADDPVSLGFLAFLAGHCRNNLDVNHFPILRVVLLALGAR
jgi:hypothetical protein